MVSKNLSEAQRETKTGNVPKEKRTSATASIKIEVKIGYSCGRMACIIALSISLSKASGLATICEQMSSSSERISVNDCCSKSFRSAKRIRSI